MSTFCESFRKSIYYLYMCLLYRYILPYIDDASQAFLLPSLPNLSSSSLHRLLVCAALWTRVKETRLPADVFILQVNKYSSNPLPIHVWASGRGYLVYRDIQGVSV